MAESDVFSAGSRLTQALPSPPSTAGPPSVIVSPVPLFQGAPTTVPPCDIKALREAVDSVRSRERKIMDFVKSPEFSLHGFHKMVVE